MDFSGQKSRVIENPTEALSVAVEEGLAWRVHIASLSLKHLQFELVLSRKLIFVFSFLLRKKDAYAWASMVVPLLLCRVQPQPWVCLLVVVVTKLLDRWACRYSYRVDVVQSTCSVIVITSKLCTHAFYFFSYPPLPTMVSPQNF